MSPPVAVVSRLSDCVAVPVDWLWPDRLAAGKLSLLDGDPSQGKSLLTLEIAARLSTARPVPGHQLREPASVLLVGAEDGLHDTVLPRLCAAGADLARIHVFHGSGSDGVCRRPPSLPEDCDLLKQVIRDTGARLVVVDPLMACLSARLSAFNDQAARRALTPVAAVAEQTGAAILMVRHLNKSGHTRNPLYRGGGAIGIIGAVRTAFLVGRDRADPELRLLACTKTNLGPMPPTLAYRIRRTADGPPTIDWAGAVEATADDIVLPRPLSHGDALPTAVDFLRELLAEGPAARDDVFAAACAAGISDRTLSRAKRRLRLLSRECQRQGRRNWYWLLPEHEADYNPDNWDDPEHRQSVLNHRELTRFLETVARAQPPENTECASTHDPRMSIVECPMTKE